MSEEELCVYLHNYNGGLNNERANSVIERVEGGLEAIDRLSQEEERGRVGKVAIASAIIPGRSLDDVEQEGRAETGTWPPLTIYRNLEELNKEK